MSATRPVNTVHSEAEVLFHRPGSGVLERMTPHPEGTACFKLHPWEHAENRTEVVVRGHIEPAESLARDARPATKVSVRPLDGTPMSEHIASIEKARAAIANGTLKKVVLSSLLNVAVESLDCTEIVRRLALAHPDSFSWILQHPDFGTWFGSSPEPLVEGEWPLFRTACLAGTRMAHTGKVSDPWNSKEQEEQELVTEGALSALRTSGCTRLSTGKRETIQYGPIEHLRTWVEFQATRPISDVIAALHPTPAVGGTPRETALDFIATHEAHDREFYTGWVGLETESQVSYYVNLRCACHRKGILTAYAGGGITAGSQPVAEWNETRNKLRAVLDPIVQWAE